MCQWSLVTLYGLVSYCSSGYSGSRSCHVDASQGLALGAAPRVSFSVTPGRNYTLFVDPRAGDTREDLIVTGCASTPLNGTHIDPWTLTAFDTLLTCTAASDRVHVSGHGTNKYFKAKVGLCPDANPDGNTLVPLLGMPISRCVFLFVPLFLCRPAHAPRRSIASKAWNENLVSPVWPVAVYPLVSAYLRRTDAITRLIASLLVANSVWWIATGIAATEQGELDVLGIIVVLSVIGVNLTLAITSLRWAHEALACFLFGVLSPVFSPFIYTPLVLLAAPAMRA